MTAIFQVSGDKTKIIYEVEADTDIIQAIIENAAEAYWPHYDTGGVEFEDATYQQKLDITWTHAKRVHQNAANSNISNKAQEVARNTASENEYVL